MQQASLQKMRREVKRYINTADEKVVKMMYAMLEDDAKKDWWDDLSVDAKASINRGLQDIKEGRVKPHDEVMKKYKKWRS